MDREALELKLQQQLKDNLLIVTGSGLSAAEGVPGMGRLADHLEIESASLTGDDAKLWQEISPEIANSGLEAALLKFQPSETLQDWIARQTCAYLLPEEARILNSAISGAAELRLTTFLKNRPPHPSGLPILTTNYDRLVEVACEIARLHVDSTCVGHFVGEFNHKHSCMASCIGTSQPNGKTVGLIHRPRAVVLKPHGSFDWFMTPDGPRRSPLSLDADRLIITPGLNKYRAGYDAPFDRHRELANEFINRASSLLVVGYGFNDDHLQVHLQSRMSSGTPTLILCKRASSHCRQICEGATKCICISEADGSPGCVIDFNGDEIARDPRDLWDLAVFTQEILS